MNIKNALRRIFCKHEYNEIAFRHNIRDNIRLYRCSKCGKEVWVDGRNDYINK